MDQQLKWFVSSLREELRDYPESNELLTDSEGKPRKETKDRFLLNATNIIYNDAVERPPKRMPIPINQMINFLWFRRGVLSYILESVAFENIRNQMPISDGGVSIDENLKGNTFYSIAQKLKNDYELGLSDQKIKYNYDTFGWGGTSQNPENRWWHY